MRKIISLLLAVSMLCLATSAMASPGTGAVTGSSNSTNTMPTSDSSAMPCFKPGTTITFNVTGLSSGEELTLITYKNGATPSDSTVQYINQYTTTGSTQAVSYTIRNGLAHGIYKLVINGSASNIATFYYKVGDATVVLIQDNGTTINTGTYGDPYVIKQASNGTYSIGFIGKVTITSDDIWLDDLGANPGFAIKDGSGTPKKYGFGYNGNVALPAKINGSTNRLEIGGSYSFIYGVTMYNVPQAKTTTIKANAVLDADN